MKLIRYQTSPIYNPSNSFTTLRDEMDRLFDVAFPTLSSLQRDGSFPSGWQGEFPVDLYQEKEAYVVRAELPGFRKEDLNVELTNGILTITGHEKTEGKAEGRDKESNVLTQERRLSRSITLPEHINGDKIKAAYENGVLTVTLPKREEVKPKQIAIDVK